MMGRTHALAGMTMSVAAQPLLASWGVPSTPAATVVMAVGGAGGSMLPDFDHMHATIARSLGPVTKAMAVAIGRLSGGHRNGTHSFLGVAVFTALSWALVQAGGWFTGLWAGFLLAVGSAALQVRFSKKSAILHTLVCLVGSCLLVWSSVATSVPFDLLTWGVGIGAFSHVVFPTDILTKEGCPLLWPLSKRRFRLARLTTDHLGEHAVVFPALMACLAGVVAWRSGLIDPQSVGHVMSGPHGQVLHDIGDLLIPPG